MCFFSFVGLSSGRGSGVLQTSYTYGDTHTLVHVYIVCGARFLRSYSRCWAVVVIRAEFDSCDDQANAEGGCGQMVDERVVVVMVDERAVVVLVYATAGIPHCASMGRLQRVNQERHNK